MITKGWFFIALSLLCASVAAAQDYVVWTGGIGIEERAAAPTDGTRLEFFLVAGNYLSDVQVVVRDNSGRELVNTVTDGPWLILDLPAGRYNVTASIGPGKVTSGVLELSGGNQKFGYAFLEE